MKRRLHIMKRQQLPIMFQSLLCVICFTACNNAEEPKPTPKTVDYIRRIPGKDETLSTVNVQKGKVLMGYSDCNACHKHNEKLVGPSFMDIAKRYPANEVYINMLAQKIILGGSGSWGYPAMAPHPKLSIDDAKKMAAYILSLDR